MPFTMAQLNELPQVLATINRQLDQITDQVQPLESLSHHLNLFYTTCKVMTHICCVVIDGEVCTNVASTYLVEKLGLITTPHPLPYQFRRLDGKGEIEVKERVHFPFKIGRYLDTVTCDVIPMEFSHILLGKPWQNDRGAVHDGRTNQYTLNHEGKRFRLAPSTPEQIREKHTIVRARLAAHFCVTPIEVVEEFEQPGELPRKETEPTKIHLLQEAPETEQPTSRTIQSGSPIEFPPSSPKDDRAIVPYQPTHPILPKQLQPHLVQREDWPKNFFSLKEFPQSGNSILAIQIGEPLRVLQYLNDGTNNFELLAEIQVLPALDASNSSTSIHNTKIDEQSPEIFQGGGNNAVIPKTAKSDTCFAQEQPPIIFFQSRDVRRFGGTVQGFLIKEPFQESGNDEVITSLPGDGVHPASIDPPITQSLRELKQLVQFRAYCFKGGTFVVSRYSIDVGHQR